MHHTLLRSKVFSHFCTSWRSVSEQNKLVSKFVFGRYMYMYMQLDHLIDLIDPTETLYLRSSTINIVNESVCLPSLAADMGRSHVNPYL